MHKGDFFPSVLAPIICIIETVKISFIRIRRIRFDFEKKCRKCFKENLKNPLVRYFRSRIAYFNKNCNYIRFEKFVRLS